MLDVSKLLFMGDNADIEKAKKDFGVNTTLTSAYIIAPFNNDYYMAIVGYNKPPDGWTKSNYLKEYHGKTQIWIPKKFKNLTDAKNSYHIFTDDNLKKFDGILEVEADGEPRINLSFQAKDHSDLDLFHDVVCEIFGIGYGPSKRSIMSDPNYDPNKDGCFCRVCGVWYKMAPTDGLSDGKMNCWECETYRLHTCRKIMSSLKG